MRGPRQRFTASRMMAWVAFDRGIRSAEGFGLEAPLDRWRAVRAEIHADVCRHGWDEARGAFVQAYGTKALDASLLLMPAVGFLPAHDRRVAGTIAAIERELLRDGLVRRYDTRESDDGLPPGEAAFLACTLWLADAYVLQERREEAQALFDRVAALCNDVGLLAEEYDPRARRMAGNFPQAFSHIALINTAHNLDGGKKPTAQRYGRADGQGPR
jgi:GH15 family glucan-1,4-alpha-glucosidase